MREKTHGKSKSIRHHPPMSVDNCTLNILGYNFKCSEMSAAFGLVQLEKFNSIMLQNYQKPTLEYIADILYRKFRVEQTGADNMHYNPLVHQVFAEEYVSEINDLL